MTEEKLTYTVREASQLLGISHIHGYLMAKRGRLPTIKMGRRVLIPRVALEKMLENAGSVQPEK